MNRLLNRRSHAKPTRLPENLSPPRGGAVERVEDAALLAVRGGFADDMGERPGTAHAAVLRSPHAHAEIVSLDATAALSMPEVVTVLTGEEVAAWSRPFIAGVKQPMRHYALAVDRVRYTGEPVAVVVARDRYAAEDALERIEVEYRELDPVVDPVAAAAPGAPLLHRDVGSNVVSGRRFRYGDPDSAFAGAEHRVAISVQYPHNACTPIEGFVVVAEHLGDDGYDILSNFQGPFTLHPVMARALGVPGARLRSPKDSGGSFGVKQAIFPYVVAMCLASRKARCPVKWVEDRLEHLLAATSATNRVTTLEAAVTGDGTIAALRWDQLDDCGAYLRAPEPASLYRTHGHMTGPYWIANLEIHNRVVLTNKTPTGLNRGFGGPQVYFALDRLVHRIAKTLGLDPLDVIHRNLVPREAFPYRAAGRRYGIGFAAVVEPSISNMGYITMALTAGERARAGPKDGAAASATVAIDPIGSVAAHVASAPQGQGHRTVLAQVIADGLGVELDDVTVNVEHDTQKDPWSIAAGNYSSRFSGAVAGAAHLAAMKLRDRLARIASTGLNVAPEALVFAGGRIFAAEPRERDAAASGRGHRPLVPRLPRRACRAGASRDHLLVDARARSTRRRRSGEQLGRLRLHLRHVRGGGRRHRPGPDRRVRHHARCRHAPEPRPRRRPDPRRVCAPGRRGAVRGARLRRRRELSLRHLRRLPRPDRVRGARSDHPPHGIAVAVHAARGEGCG